MTSIKIQKNNNFCLIEQGVTCAVKILSFMATEFFDFQVNENSDTIKGSVF